jgi:acyl-CoA dehydrogenase
LVRTTATLDGDHWVLNGEKIFVHRLPRRGRGGVGDGRPRRRARGIKSFLVLKGTRGSSLHTRRRSSASVPTIRRLRLQDCRIPRDQLLGGDENIPKESSGGFRGVMKTFNATRPMVAAIGLGMAEAHSTSRAMRSRRPGCR